MSRCNVISMSVCASCAFMEGMDCAGVNGYGIVGKGHFQPHYNLMGMLMEMLEANHIPDPPISTQNISYLLIYVPGKLHLVMY